VEVAPFTAITVVVVPPSFTAIAMLASWVWFWIVTADVDTLTEILAS
jgi:hypothetical protein